MRYAAAALVLLAATACTDSKPRAIETAPPIATDACPAESELLDQAPVGGGLPDVSLRCIGHDGTVRMALLGRTPTVVNLWGSWCFPCRTEMPEFQQVHAAFGDRVRFLGVDTKDFENPARSAIQRAGVSYASVFDPDEHIKRAVGTRSLPTTILVGTDGKIRNVHVGELTGAELRAAIEKYLGVTPETPSPVADGACAGAGLLPLRCVAPDGTVRTALAGRTPTVVNLWGSWCFPCRTELPEFEKVHAALGDTVRFVGVDTKDDEDSARSAIERAGVSYASAFDPDEHIKREFGVRSLPATILIGSDGEVRSVQVGELTGAELRAEITKYLGV